jgi:predicted acylesterase/phospholipase RssA
MADLKTLGKYYLLSTLHILQGLSPAEKSILAEKAILKTLKRHDVLYKQGEKGDYFYIILNGSVELYSTVYFGDEKSEISVGVMRKGDFLGIVSLMDNKPHALSARALGEVRLLLINVDDFQLITQQIPSLGVLLTKALARRLNAVNNESDRKIIETNIISVFCKDSDYIGSKFSALLSEHIINLTSKKSIVLRFNKKSESPIRASSKIKNFHYDSLNEILEKFNMYKNSYDFIILDLPEDNYDICRALLQNSDFCKIVDSVQYNKKDFLDLYDLQKEYNTDFLEIVQFKENPTNQTINNIALKLSRGITGMNIGLALGGGAAFGLAQIGVLKVLERENIPIDIVSGTSIGSLVGALWAGGISASDIEKATFEFNSVIDIFKLVDFNIMPTRGLIPGNNIRKFLEGFLGQKTFLEMNKELRIVTCNINNREEVILKNGSVVDAILASTAIPGLFNPFINKDGSVYVDGGVVNPLPVSALTIEGIQRIIAVNAMPSPEDSVKSNKKDQSIMDIFINSFYSLQYRLCKYSFQSSDIYLSPILSNASWYEFYKAKEFIELGERVCEENIQEIKNLAFKY